MSNQSLKKPLVFCLMGPTASGKTPLAIELVQQFPFEIVSVDSAMIYRCMDIGTAKPSKDILRIAPHRLIDIRDPIERYSAGTFRTDALQTMEDIIAKNKIPLLVGGTMLYFRVLQQGIASLPRADTALRGMLVDKAEKEGWESLYQDLAKIDPEAAKRIHPRDAQRIQRALEVYYLTGKTISSLQMEESHPLSHYQVCSFALIPSQRADLHLRIAKRFQAMLQLGLVDEVGRLFERGDLSLDLPSIRSVGYRQIWEYFLGKSSYDEMCEKTIAATRQLAKRQLTWLRSWPHLTRFDSDNAKVVEEAKGWVRGNLD